MDVKKTRYAKISVLTDATLYDFRNGRILIECNYNETVLLSAFVGIKDFNAFEKNLYDTEEINDEKIPSRDIEEIRWGHYIDENFVKSIENLLKDINYDQEINQIVILLLLFKLFYKYHELSLETNEKTGALALIDFINNIDQVEELSANLRIKVNRKISHFDAEAVTLLHVVFKEYFKTSAGNKFLFIIKLLINEDYEIIKDIKNLQGGDKGRSKRKYTHRLIRLLFIHFYKYCNEKSKRLVLIGTLIDLTISGKSAKQIKENENSKIKYAENLRHIVKGMK